MEQDGNEHQKNEEEEERLLERNGKQAGRNAEGGGEGELKRRRMLGSDGIWSKM